MEVAAQEYAIKDEKGESRRPNNTRDKQVSKGPKP